jgi:hypothetical protein
LFARSDRVSGLLWSSRVGHANFVPQYGEATREGSTDVACADNIDFNLRSLKLGFVQL